MMNLKTWIKAERDAGRHWTMVKVADAVDIAPPNLSRAVNGHGWPSCKTVLRVHRLTDGAVGLFDWPKVIEDAEGGKE